MSVAHRKSRRSAGLPPRFKEFVELVDEAPVVPDPPVPPEPESPPSTALPPLPDAPASPVQNSVLGPRDTFGLLREYCRVALARAHAEPPNFSSLSTSVASTPAPTLPSSPFPSITSASSSNPCQVSSPSSGSLELQPVTTSESEDARTPTTSGSSHAEPPLLLSPYGAYPNESSFLLGEWFWQGNGQLSQRRFLDLVKLISSPDFRMDDIRHTKWRQVDAVLAGPTKSTPLSQDEDGWVRTSISITVPFHSRMACPGPEEFLVGAFHHRKLVDVIRERISSPEYFSHFHTTPFRSFWSPGGTTRERVHGELYCSDAFLAEHEAVQKMPLDCSLPRAIAALMFASDGTQLTSFSDAKLWPLYVSFGNESKYRRCKPRCKPFSHVAYFESVCTRLQCLSAWLLTAVFCPDAGCFQSMGG